MIRLAMPVRNSAPILNPPGRDADVIVQRSPTGARAMSIPLKDSELVTYSANVNQRLIASGTTVYQLPASVVAAFTPLHLAFADAYSALTVAREAGIRSEALTSAKERAKADLLLSARQIYAAVQHNASISDADKISIGVVVRARKYTIVPPPSTAPVVNIISVSGRTVFLSIQGATVERARPAGCIGAQLLSFTGDQPPADRRQWDAPKLVGRSRASIEFPSTYAPGTKVWLAARWFNNRKQTGPISMPVFAYLGFDVSKAA